MTMKGRCSRKVEELIKLDEIQAHAWNGVKEDPYLCGRCTTEDWLVLKEIWSYGYGKFILLPLPVS